jgi:TonB family protein
MRLIFIIVAASVAACGQEWRFVRIVGLSEYPALARQAGISGRVVLRCTVKEKTEAASCSIVSGHKVLAQAARNNAEKWRFQISGANSRTISLVYNFELTLRGSTHERPITSFVFEYPDIVTVTSPRGCSDHLPCLEEE